MSESRPWYHKQSIADTNEDDELPRTRDSSPQPIWDGHAKRYRMPGECRVCRSTDTWDDNMAWGCNKCGFMDCSGQG